MFHILFRSDCRCYLIIWWQDQRDKRGRYPAFAFQVLDQALQLQIFDFVVFCPQAALALHPAELMRAMQWNSFLLGKAACSTRRC